MKSDEYWGQPSKKANPNNKNKADLHMTGAHEMVQMPTNQGVTGSGLGHQVGLPASRYRPGTLVNMPALKPALPPGSLSGANIPVVQPQAQPAPPSHPVAPKSAPPPPPAPASILEARFDALTGVFQFAYIISRLHEEFLRARFFGRGFAVMVLTIDGYQKIGLDFGPLALDRAAEAVGQVLQSVGRPVDLAGRLSENRFLIICPELPPEQAVEYAKHLRDTLTGQPIKHQWESFPLSVSVGIAVLSEQIADVDTLLTIADLSADVATESGGGRVCLEAEEVG